MEMFLYLERELELTAKHYEAGLYAYLPSYLEINGVSMDLTIW